MKLNLVVKYRISFTFSADFQTVLTDTKTLLVVSTFPRIYLENVFSCLKLFCQLIFLVLVSPLQLCRKQHKLGLQSQHHMTSNRYMQTIAKKFGKMFLTSNKTHTGLLFKSGFTCVCRVLLSITDILIRQEKRDKNNHKDT